MLSSEQKVIDIIIDCDEGGWKLTSSSNDNDGGWTFAGITANVWNEYYGELSPFSHTDMAHFIAGDLERAKSEIYSIYYDGYYQPLQNALHPITNIAPSLLSCAVNCGVNTAVSLINKVKGDHLAFLRAWHLYYCDLVRANAEAWRDYARDLEEELLLEMKASERLDADGRINQIQQERPRTLRAEYIAGWFNRVERYRSGE